MQTTDQCLVRWQLKPNHTAPLILEGQRIRTSPRSEQTIGLEAVALHGSDGLEALARKGTIFDPVEVLIRTGLEQDAKVTGPIVSLPRKSTAPSLNKIVIVARMAQVAMAAQEDRPLVCDNRIRKNNRTCQSQVIHTNEISRPNNLQDQKPSLRPCSSRSGSVGSRLLKIATSASYWSSSSVFS